MFYCIPCQDSPAPGIHILPPSDSNMHPGISLRGFCRCDYGSKSVNLKIGSLLVVPNLLKTKFSWLFAGIKSELEAYEGLKVIIAALKMEGTMWQKMRGCL